MNVKVYAMSIEAVRAALNNADAESFELVGSHDNSRRVVYINGIQRPVRKHEYISYSVQSPEHRKKITDPGEIQEVILTAAVLETHSHFGDSQRPRSLLRIFLRRNGMAESFLVLDIGQVNSIFLSPNLGEVLALARKMRVEVIQEGLEEALCPLRWEGFYDGSMGELAGNEYLHADVAQAWFTIMFQSVVKLYSAFQVLCKGHLQTFGEHRSFWVPAVQPLFEQSLLGRFMHSFNDGGKFNPIS